MKTLAITIFSTYASTCLAFADQTAQLSEFQLIITQGAGKMTALNMAFGQGDDIRFFSNIDTSAVVWDESLGSSRSGTLTALPKDGVILGVCAGGTCQVSNGLNFTTSVGSTLP